MHPVSFAAVRPFYAQPTHKHKPAFGAADPRRQLDELCESVATASPGSIKDIVTTSLEEAARLRDTYAVRRIENALIDLVEGLERGGVSVAGILHEIGEGLKETRAYTPSMIADDASGKPAFSDWYDSKTGEYERELEALEGPEDWTRRRMNDAFNRRH